MTKNRHISLMTSHITYFKRFSYWETSLTKRYDQPFWIFSSFIFEIFYSFLHGLEMCTLLESLEQPASVWGSRWLHDIQSYQVFFFNIYMKRNNIVLTSKTSQQISETIVAFSQTWVFYLKRTESFYSLNISITKSAYIIQKTEPGPMKI